MWCLKHRWLQNAASFRGLEKNLVPQPTHPWNHRKWGARNSRVEREPMQNKGNTELIPRKLANCGKDCAWHRCDGHEFKPHLRGHWDKAHNSGEVLHGARSLTSNRMLPHCINLEGLSTQGLKQRRPRPPPPRARAAAHCYQCCALSAAGCKMQCPSEVWKILKRKKKTLVLEH